MGRFSSPINLRRYRNAIGSGLTDRARILTALGRSVARSSGIVAASALGAERISATRNPTARPIARHDHPASSAAAALGWVSPPHERGDSR
jgi:hypothetical protein